MSRVAHSCPHCGSMLTKPRSSPDHRRLFALIAKAFHQWPEASEFQPTSAEHLRAYLQCKVGYHECTPVFTGNLRLSPEDKQGNVAFQLVTAAVEATVAASLAEGTYAFVRVHGDTVAVFRPKSIAWSELDQKAFGPIREAIEAEIESALGVTCEALLRAEAA